MHKCEPININVSQKLPSIRLLIWLLIIILTSRVLVDGKSPVCVICTKYWILILIIIIISLGQILLSYIANTSRRHACTHAHMHTRTHARTCTHAYTRAHAPTHSPPSLRLSLFDVSMTPNRDASHWSLAINGRSLLHSNIQSRGILGIRDSFGCLRAYKKNCYAQLR